MIAWAGQGFPFLNCSLVGDYETVSDLRRTPSVARRRRKVQRAGLLVDGAREGDVRMLGQTAVAPTGHRHQRHADTLDRRNDGGEFVALPRVRDREHDVARRHHAEIAVARFARVNEHGRRTGRGQGGGDLARDVAALAHAGHHHAALRAEDHAQRLHERLADAALQARDRLGLDVEDILRELDEVLRVGEGVGM